MNVSFLMGIALAMVSSFFYLQNYIIIAVICFAGIYVVENLRKPIGIGFVAENIPSGIMASVLSVESQAHSITTALLAPLAGWLTDMIGIGYALLSICLFALIISPFLMLSSKQNP
jgi:hypothetical protein